MDFGNALELLKCGKNQHIELAKVIYYKTLANTASQCTHNEIDNNCIAFVGTSGTQMSWLASQADMLAEDWEVVE